MLFAHAKPETLAATPLAATPSRAVKKVMRGAHRSSSAVSHVFYGSLGRVAQAATFLMGNAGNEWLRVAFSLVSFFWLRKRKILDCRARPTIQTKNLDHIRHFSPIKLHTKFFKLISEVSRFFKFQIFSCIVHGFFQAFHFLHDLFLT